MEKPLFTVGDKVYFMNQNKVSLREVKFVLECENTIYYGLTYPEPVIYGPEDIVWHNEAHLFLNKQALLSTI